MEITISGLLCPTEGCGRVMNQMGELETVDIHDGLPFDPPQKQPLYVCPVHGGRYFKTGKYFLANLDELPE